MSDSRASEQERWSLLGFGLGVATFLAYSIILLPIVVIVISSFNPSSALTFPPSSLSLKWYKEFFATDDMVSALVWSIVIAVSSSVVAVLLGTAAAVALIRGKLRLKGASNPFLALPVILP